MASVDGNRSQKHERCFDESESACKVLDESMTRSFTSNPTSTASIAPSTVLSNFHDILLVLEKGLSYFIHIAILSNFCQG